MTNRLNKILMAGASPLLVLAFAAPAFAQTTGTQALESSIETVTVTGERDVSGIMKPITVPKERSTITQDYLVTQTPGQTVFESLNKVPGFSFTNNDPYGTSGGDVRVHGYDGNHISLTWDGMPLNDTGNYAIYTNQLPDPEDISSVSVNQGTTDSDSPSAAASGGVVAMTTSRPSADMKFMAQPSFGSYNFERYFLRADSGEFGPWNTTAFVSGSYSSNDKFKGPGRLQKKQFNASLYQDLGELGFITLSAHFNQNRNNNYYSLSFYPIYNGLAFPINGGPSAPQVAYDANGNFAGVGAQPAATSNSGYGLKEDYATTCARVAGVNGTAQFDTTCSNFYGRQINPSDTGNIRISSLFNLTDSLILTVDPSIQYVLADGGSQYTQLSERDPRLIGASGAVGKDLNGDGDTLDTVGVFGPSVTNTIRYGLNTSVLWHLDEDNTFQAAYTLDYGLHRQTGSASYLTSNGFATDPFGGYHDLANRVFGSDGSPFRLRDRASHAILNQGAFDYEGKFFDDTLHVSAGVRLPFLERDLNQKCYLEVVAPSGTLPSPNATPGVGFPACSTAQPTSTNAANNTVTLAGEGNALFVKPATESVNFSRTLPSLGFTYSPWGKEAMFFIDYATGISVPRTDNLYNGGNNGKCLVGTTLTPTNPGCVFSSFNNSVLPETSVNYDAGVRYNSDLITASLTAYNNQFKNRIVTSFDPDQGISIDRNIGSVNVDGVDVEGDLFPMDDFSIYNSISYLHSRVSDTPSAHIALNATGTQVVNIAGKEVVETPNWTVSQRYQYKIEGFTIGFGGKYTGRRYATDTNDLRVPSYIVADADISYDLGKFGWDNSFIKFDAQNLFNEKYFGSISSQRCFVINQPSSVTGCGSYPFMYVGAPQSFVITLRGAF